MDNKVTNCLRWFKNIAQRYHLPDSIVSWLGPDELLQDRDKRQKLVTEMLPMIVMASEDTKTLARMVRAFYEKMSDEERKQFIQEQLLPLARDYAEKTASVVKFIEENEDQVAMDLRFLGAYMTIFTKGYLQ